MARRRTNVLIFQPEGNFRGNPTMDALLRGLHEVGLSTTIVALADDRVNQDPPTPSSGVVLIDGWRRAILRRLLERSVRWPLVWFLRSLVPLPSADTQIGVDPLGIRLSDAWRTSDTTLRCLISFEIFFREEVPERTKSAETLACRDVDLAVAQDPVRADLLARENAIPRDRIVEVPVAPRGVPPNVAPGYLRDYLSIGEATRIVAVVGSVAPWSGLDLLLGCAERVPDGWAMVLHDRYGFEGSPIEEVPGPVSLSKRPVAGIEGLSRLLVDVDVGIAFYTPTYENPYVGDNIRHVGLASGKVSMYLQHGIPILVNDQDLLGDVVERERLGVRITGPDEFPAALERIAADLDRYRARCRVFFEEHLDASRSLEPVVASLARAARRNP